MRNKIGHLAMVAALLSAVENNPNSRISYKPEPSKLLPPKGTRFIIEGIEIYALNEKNARRKYRNLMNKT